METLESLELLLSNKEIELEKIKEKKRELDFLLKIKKVELEKKFNIKEINANLTDNLCGNQELFAEGDILTYKKSLTIGRKTNNIEKIKLSSKFNLFGPSYSVFATSKKIIGISLIDKWNDGTNGEIRIVKNKDTTIITCHSQPFRGHCWKLLIYYT
jgi:hypothetical protein